MVLNRLRTRPRWLAALLPVLVAGSIVMAASVASARTDLPVYGEEVVYTDGFDQPWEVELAGTGTGCGNCVGVQIGDPEASLGIGTNGWAAVRKTIKIRTKTSFGVSYDYCRISAAVMRGWARPSTSPALINLEAINPSTWNYLSYSRHVLRTSNEVRITSGTFVPNPRQFVVGVALVADPNSVDVGSLNTMVGVDDFIVTCHYFYYP